MGCFLVSKYTLDFKKKVVSDYLNNEGGYRYLGHKYQIDHTLVREWVKVYGYHGWSGLEGGSKSYTTSFKLSVIQYIHEHKLSNKEAAQKFNIGSHSTIRKWLDLYNENGASALENKKRGRPTNMKLDQSSLNGASKETLEKEVLRLRAENAYLKKLEALIQKQDLSKKKSRSKQLFSSKKKYKLTLLLSIAKMAKSTFYYWVKKLAKPDKYSVLKKEIKSIVEESKYTYGYRRVTIMLKRKGHIVNHKTVRKLMSQLNLTCRIRRKRYKSYKGTVGKVAENILKREFTKNKPNTKWVTDVTEFNVRGNKLYLSPILDLFNGEIISYSVSTKPHYKMIDEMLKKALENKKMMERPVLHSDQGWQYQMSDYQKN